MIEDHDENHNPPSSTTTRPRRGRLIATVLAGLCVLTLVGGLALAFWLRAESTQNAEAEQDRIDVMEAAEEFTVTWNTFRPSDADTYVDRVSPLLSSKFRTEFTDAAEDVMTGITQQRLFSKGEVLRDGDGIPLVGVASIDNDSAEVLVVADAKRVANRQRVLRHWRWQVSLVKVDGKWLVDSFKEV